MKLKRGPDSKLLEEIYAQLAQWAERKTPVYMILCGGFFTMCFAGELYTCDKPDTFNFVTAHALSPIIPWFYDSVSLEKREGEGTFVRMKRGTGKVSIFEIGSLGDLASLTKLPHSALVN